jgi:hypothetical protein
MAIRHAFTSAIADGGNSALVQPSNWNANHEIDEIITAAVTYYVCPSGQTVANYNGDGLNTAVTPSDSNSGLTKALPLATIAAAAAKIAGKVLLAPVTIQLADTDATKAYFPDNVEFNAICAGAAPYSSALQRAIYGRLDVFPTAYVYVKGNLTTPNNVNVTGASTYNGTTSTKDCAFLARNTYLRVNGMKLNYFRSANGDGGAIEGHCSVLVAENINCTSDHTGNDGSLVSGFEHSHIMFGGTNNVTNSGILRASVGSKWQTYSPTGYASCAFTHSGTNVFVMFSNEKSHGMFQGGTWTFAGAGTYSILTAFAGSTINMNNDATTTITVNAASSTFNDARQDSAIFDTSGTASTPVTFTSMLRRAFVRNGSHVSYNGTTAGSSADSCDGGSTIANGTFPYVLKTTSTLEGYQEMKEISAPATPATDCIRFYCKDNGSGVSKLYYKDSAGTEIGPLGAAGATLAGNTFTGAQLISESGIQKPLEIIRTDTGQTQFSCNSGGSNAWESFVINAERRSNTYASPSFVADGYDILSFNGAVYGSGSGASAVYNQAAQILFEAAGTSSSSSSPGRITMSTTPAASTTLVERFRIDENGDITAPNIRGAATNWCGAIYTSITPVTVSANVSTAQNLMSFSVPAGSMNKLLKSLRIFGRGLYTTAGAQTPTLTVAITIGGVSVLSFVSTATTASQTNLPWEFEAWITTSLVGSSGTVEAHGQMQIKLGSGASGASTDFLDTNTAASSAINLTNANTLQVTITSSTASASNSFTQRQMIAELMN